MGDYPLTGPRFSHYAPNYYVRQSGDAVKVRLYIYHYKDAEEICKKMNEPKEGDDEDLVVPKDQELQFLVTVASVQTAIPTATHFLYPSSRYMDLDRLIKEIKEDTAYKSLPFQPTLGAEVRMIKMKKWPLRFTFSAQKSTIPLFQRLSERYIAKIHLNKTV